MPRARTIVFVVGDAILLALALVLSAALRFDGAIPLETARQLPIAIGIDVVAKVALFSTQGLYSLSWAQVGLDGMVAVVRGVTLGSVIFWALVFALKHTHVLVGFPRSVLLIDYILTLHAIGAFRIGRRVFQHITHPYPVSGRPALIVGAGAAGEQLAKSLRYSAAPEYAPVGYIDDDSRKRGTVIQGLRVLGDRRHLPRVIREYGVEAVLIAIPSGASRLIRAIVSTARQAGVREVRIIPGLESILDGEITFGDLREVQLADLLGREVVTIDTRMIEQSLKGRTVLVTGAGGSVGSELCRQIAGFRPDELVLLDCDETGLFNVEQKMRRLRQRSQALLVDVRDAGQVARAFRKVRPQVVFHAAAYKHVGLMERHPVQAVSVNILGTHVVASVAIQAGVEKFVLISTDKAVNPTSVMGATKRVAEQVCLALNVLGPTRCLAVRFGNVLGSRGSVVPLFQEKIRRGEPLTIRGPNMRRYFMSVSEAARLVLQAGAAGRGGEIFVLDMGEPIQIVDLARELVRLSGLEPDKDVPIVFADAEPGEKEHEDLLAAEEGTLPTQYERIHVARALPSSGGTELFTRIAALEAMVERHDLEGILATLCDLVPNYRPSDLLVQAARVRSDAIEVALNASLTL
jgi:FlaA1/EpsC-like NDP-sugar epimerase